LVPRYDGKPTKLSQLWCESGSSLHA
jgi:hypothetical protein